jgi:hypothetical protein
VKGKTTEAYIHKLHLLEAEIHRDEYKDQTNKKNNQEYQEGQEDDKSKLMAWTEVKKGAKCSSSIHSYI